MLINGGACEWLIRTLRLRQCDAEGDTLPLSHQNELAVMSVKSEEEEGGPPGAGPPNGDTPPGTQPSGRGADADSRPELWVRAGAVEEGPTQGWWGRYAPGITAGSTAAAHPVPGLSGWDKEAEGAREGALVNGYSAAPGHCPGELSGAGGWW